MRNFWIINKYRDYILQWTNRILPVIAIIAFTSLVAEYGFYINEDGRRIVAQLNFVVLYGFIVHLFFKFISVRKPLNYLRNHILEAFIFLIVLFHLLFPSHEQALISKIDPTLSTEMIASLYIIFTQLFLLLAFLLSAVQGSRKIMSFSIQPSKLIVISFIFFIACGTGLLLLPRCTGEQGISIIDALFSSTSAVCVTGLVVLDTSYNFTVLGQAVILALIQLGGLGIMTLTTFFAYLMGSSTSLREYSHLKVLLGQENVGKIKQTIFRIVLFTLLSECIGAVAIYITMAPEFFHGNIDRIWFAIFHSISAFCNAGFSLTSTNLMDMKFIYNFSVQSVIIGLIFLGGLGYPVVSNLGSFLLNTKKDRSLRRLSVHTKIVLITSVVLIFFGVAVIWIIESNNSLRGLSFGEQLFASLFQSVSARTAGFNTIDIGLLSVPTLLVIIFLMWVGASPGSTGGGIKTTALFLSVLNIVALIRGKNQVEVFRKQIADAAIVRSFSVIVLSIFFIGTATFLLAIIEPFPLERILFEVVSAIGTVGYSTGITAALSVAGKVIIIITMFVGRVGLLAILISITRHKVEGRFAYTRENVLVT